MRPAYFVLGAVLCSVSMIAVQAAEKKKAGAVPASTPEMIEKGKASYATNCLSCHGASADGMGPAGQYLNPKPRNLVKDTFKKGDKPENVFDVITNGLPGTTMTAFGHLKEDERWALTHYVLSLRKK